MATYKILTDDHIRESLTMDDVIRKIEDALLEKANGTLNAPPRFRIDSNHGALVFTAGAATGQEKVMGFRVYDTFSGEHPDRHQIVAVYDSDTGALKGIVIGETIGMLRTGAIGGVAIKHMSRPVAQSLAIFGTGHHARTQLEAAVLVRNFKRITVYSRNEENRQRFATEMSRKLDREIEPMDSPKLCVEHADVIICATTSRVPVFDASWVRPGAHINTVGPKSIDAHELPLEVGIESSIIASDSVEQLHAYPTPHFMTNLSPAKHIVELSDIVAGRVAGRKSVDDMTLFCSVGLAGTEVVVAGEALNR